MTKSKSALLVLIIALLSLLAAAGETQKPATATDNKLMSEVAKIKVGSSTQAEVTNLLGTPWRSTDDRDCHPVDYQYAVWEYVGQDATGLFRIHIGFDEDNIARIIAKIPQTGRITVLAMAPKPDSHQH